MDVVERLRRLSSEQAADYIENLQSRIVLLEMERDALRRDLLEAEDEIRSWQNSHPGYRE